MISDSLATKIIIAGLMLGFCWLGYCTGREFVQNQSYSRTK